jgi:hypothetical protein
VLPPNQNSDSPHGGAARNAEETHLRGKVLVLSHSNAGGEELEPYAASVFAPMPVLVLMGRSAVVDPPCPKEHAVWYGWRDFFRRTRRAARE